MNSILRPVHQVCRVKLEPGVAHVSESSVSNQSDVVIVRPGLCSFNNRWRLENDVIDYNAIRFWTGTQEFANIRLNWSSVKRLKIYGLARHQMTELLSKLNSFTSVTHLEIDTLELHMGVNSRYTFDSLDLLSIDSVRVIDINGSEKRDAFSTLEINAKELNTVYLGSNSIEYIKFDAPKIVILSTDRIPANADFTQPPFRDLQAFMCNRVHEVNIELIGQITRGELLPELQRLCCNTDRLLFTTYRPNTMVFNQFERLFNHLVVYGVRPNLEIYLNHCQFDPRRKASDYQFKADLIHMHFFNYVINQLNLQRCPSVRCVEYLGFLDVMTLKRKKDCERVFDLSKFTRLYNCIQVVVLDNEQQSAKRNVRSDLFLRFLGAQQALTDLELRGARFTDENFYFRLVTLTSLKATLNTLIVFEERGEFQEHIDFRFLNAFGSLRRLQTNLVPVSAMPNLVGTMPDCSEFRLHCWHSTLGSGYFLFNIRRVSGLYQLRVDLRGPKELQKNVHAGDYSLQGIKCVLQQEKKIPHWLDEVPMRRSNQLSLLLVK